MAANKKKAAGAGTVPDPSANVGVKADSSSAPRPSVSPEKKAMLDRLKQGLDIECEITEKYGNVLFSREQPLLLICILKELVAARLWREKHDRG